MTVASRATQQEPRHVQAVTGIWSYKKAYARRSARLDTTLTPSPYAKLATLTERLARGPHLQTEYYVQKTFSYSPMKPHVMLHVQ